MGLFNFRPSVRPGIEILDPVDKRLKRPVPLKELDTSETTFAQEIVLTPLKNELTPCCSKYFWPKSQKRLLEWLLRCINAFSFNLKINIFTSKAVDSSERLQTDFPLIIFAFLHKILNIVCKYLALYLTLVSQ